MEWQAKSDGSGGYNIVDEKGRVIGCTSGAFSNEIPAGEEDRIARLISAAPDLLEACQEMRWLSTLSHEEACTKMDAAIAKAERQ